MIKDFKRVNRWGLKQEEAARLLNISVWTLRRHFRNAKLRLHEWFGEEQH